MWWHILWTSSPLSTCWWIFSAFRIRGSVVCIVVFLGDNFDRIVRGFKNPRSVALLPEVGEHTGLLYVMFILILDKKGA